MLSNTCKYGIRAMIYLAVNQKENSNIGIKKISKDLDLPSPFLGKILQNLVKEGLLSSTKGPHGGFSLKKDPYEISMYDIVKIIDGESVFEDCFLGLKICEENPEHADECEFRKTSHGVRLQLRKAYKQQTVGSFAESIKNSDKAIKY
jgi:Rrf2 family protein